VSPGYIRALSVAEAAAAVRDCRSALAESGSTVVREATSGATEIADWRRYPASEVYDPASHAQYFYHCHPGPERPAREHGHFHLFLRAEGIPPGITPLVLPELAVANAMQPPQAAPAKRGARDEIAHLVAITVDERGEPIRLFTTNRWVTGETWYRAEDAIRLLDRFVVTHAEPSALLNRWLGAIIGLYRGDIASLLRQRDDTVMGWRWRRRVHVFEDPRLEITSSLAIDLDARLAEVDALAAAPGDPAMRRPSRLPPMAEGWGV
jgi:hypothetical protein